MKKNLFLLIFIAVLFTGCSKSDDTQDPVPGCELNAANIAGTYKVTAIRYKINSGTPELDAYSIYLEDCQKDDLYVLNNNGTLNYNDAGTQCNPPGSYTNTWTLAGNVLTINGRSFTITSFNCATATGTTENLVSAGDKATFTFTKQ